MAQVLLTVSGVIAPDTVEKIAQGARPRADYFELAQAFEADIMDYAAARRNSGWFGWLLERLSGPNLLLAWACYCRRRHYHVIFTDGEQVGIPLATLLKYATIAGHRARHVMIVHILSVGKKMLLFDVLGLQSHVDIFLVYATWQQQFIQRRWKVPAQRVVFTPFMVDADFFAPDKVTPNPTSRPMICSVGLESRDYPTLIQAVRGLDIQVVIAAASPWARQADSTQGQHIPENVTVQRFSQYELRQLYADSRFVVMPLLNVNYQAGVTAILEAMAMGRAVICSRTPGQTDVVIDGETGLYVPPGDPDALRAAIMQLVTHPDQAARMGQAGRRRIEQEMSLDHYTARLSRVVASVQTNGEAVTH